MPYLKSHGYVGIGRVINKAVPIQEFRQNGQSLRNVELKEPNIFENWDNDKTEYLLKVEWIRSVNRAEAKWNPKSKLFTTQLIRSSLQGQKETMVFLEKEFDIQFSEILLT